MVEEKVEYKEIENVKRIKCNVTKDNYYNCIVETKHPTITTPPIINYPKTSSFVFDHIEFGYSIPSEVLIDFKDNVDCDINPHSTEKNTIANIVCHESMKKKEAEE